jgi:ATP dependent DNA ligase domain
LLLRPTFIPPQIPRSADSPPRGTDWIHEPKLDGYRFQVIKNGDQVRICSRSGADYSDRLPRMVEWFAHLPTHAAVLDGELCLIDATGAANFRRLMAEMRTRRPDEKQLAFMVFDLLHQNGVDLRELPLLERKRDLRRLCRRSRVPFMREIETFPDGQMLHTHCNYFGFEGVISKRTASRYVSGPSRSWLKVKCPDWKAENEYRHLLFEGPKKRVLSERQRELTKTRQELRCVLERMQRPALSKGMALELEKYQALLQREIAKVEAGGCHFLASAEPHSRRNSYPLAPTKFPPASADTNSELFQELIC